MSNKKLNDLHTAIIDAVAGYETAVKDADSPAASRIFQHAHEMHSNSVSELDAALVAKGETPDDDGSFMGTVHKTIIGARSALTGLDEHSFASFADGEERLLKSYDEALAKETNAETRTILARQRAGVVGLIAELKTAGRE